MIFAILFSILVITKSSALIISQFSTDSLKPGSEGVITATIENDLPYDIKRVSMAINLQNTPFTSVGTTVDTVSEIEEDKKKSFGFRIKASPSTKPGNYQIPFTINYYDNKDSLQTLVGAFGVSVIAEPELSYSISQENPVIGSKGRVTLKIINQGLADAKFVSVKVSPVGFTLLSESHQYLGTINSDDFETASFDIILNKPTASLNAIIEYTDFENKKQLKNVVIPMTSYTPEKALELGIIKRDYTLYYIILALFFILVFFVWRALRKRRRLKRSMQNQIRG